MTSSKGSFAGLVVALMAGIGFSPARAVILYSTGFENPPFAAGDNTWAGTDGWESTDISGSIQGIDSGGGDQFAFLGSSPPQDESNFVWKTFDYDPVGAGTPILQVAMEIGVIDSSNGEYDSFYVGVSNAKQELLGAIIFRNDNYNILRFDGVRSFTTGATFEGDTFQTLEFAINFETNVWSASAKGVSLFSNVGFHSGGKSLDFGELDYIWRLASQSSPGDNYLILDNLSVQAAAPEPSSATLLAVSGLFLGRYRRRRQPVLSIGAHRR